MALYEGYDPTLAGGRGGYVLGSQQGGPDPNAGRDSIAQAVMAQRGMSGGGGGGFDIARGPDQNFGGGMPTPGQGGVGGYQLGTFQGGPDPNAWMYGGGGQGVGGSQAGDASSIDTGALFGGSTPSFTSGMPSGPGFGSSFGGGGQQSFAPGGQMTTSNASMVGDPLGEAGPTPVSGFGHSGDDTSAQSQAAQAAQAEAMAAAAAGRAPQSDPFEAASQAFGSGFGRSFGGFSPNAPQDAPLGNPPSGPIQSFTSPIAGYPVGPVDMAPLGPPSGSRGAPPGGGTWPSGRSFTQGPDVNDPGDQAAMAASASGFGGGQGGYDFGSGFNAPGGFGGGGGWGGFDAQGNSGFGGFSSGGFGAEGVG